MNSSTVTRREIILKYNHNNYIFQYYVHFLFTFQSLFCLDCLDVADVRQTFHNVDNLYDLFTNVAGETILNFLKNLIYMQKYFYIPYVLNIWFYIFNVSFICTYYLIVS